MCYYNKLPEMGSFIQKKKKKTFSDFLEDRKFKNIPAGLWLVMHTSLHPIEGKNAMPSSTRQEVEGRRRPRDQTPWVRPSHKGTNQFPSTAP